MTSSRPYVVELPYPPTVNHYFENARRTSKRGKAYVGRRLSAEAIAYRAEVARAVRAGHAAPPRLSGRLSITVYVHPPRLSRLRDLDNLAKPLWDALKTAGVVLDDSQFDELRMIRDLPSSLGSVLVSITPLGTGR